ncbi:peptidoglycan recognition family protein [Streptomyces sp. NPDC002055]|uniref:N-acetylmuramoyl-L-alanine amidase n=1 Tax=Streptomyces sp. NPDC002055 TaxID=3154534 RepID=UPI00331A715B
MRGSAHEGARGTRRLGGRAAVATAGAALLIPLVAAAPSATAARPDPYSLEQAFTDAAQRYQVPRSVLLGVSYLQSRWDSHHGEPSVSGGYGPMHLTDARTALAEAPPLAHGGEEDPRGDGSRARRTVPEQPAKVPEPSEVPARLRTLQRAAELTDLAPRRLREDDAANISGGAALLAAAQESLGLPLSGDPAQWYAAVARYSGADDRATAAGYADDVFEVIRHGERRTTDSGQEVALPGAPGLEPATEQAPRLGLRATAAGKAECPAAVACEWIPAPYKEFGEGSERDYGNHDKADRPRGQKIEYIIVHDTEGPWDVTIDLIKDPTYVSWQYSLRSSDGHVAQHVPLKDVAWHSGNWFVNSKSIGLEHEGFLTAPDAWYTEAMYRASARLVQHLAKRFDIPLDRQHILGHDNVPGPTAMTIPGMHTDPGPYWDWAHYFELLGAPLRSTADAKGGLVTIRPDYARNKPVYTGCKKDSKEKCPSHGSGAVRLHTAPRADAPLVKDIGLHPPNGDDSTTGVNDLGARASTGQQFAVAERKGDWTAVWYLGQKAWFHNPAKQPTAVNAKGRVATPKAGRKTVEVFGRAYPEAAAYPKDIPVQPLSALPYKLGAGEKYAVGPKITGEYYYAPTFDTKGHRVVRGKQKYYQIQAGHRVAFVKAEDVTVRQSDQ